jgi:hypothetical protein
MVKRENLGRISYPILIKSSQGNTVNFRLRLGSRQGLFGSEQKSVLPIFPDPIIFSLLTVGYKNPNDAIEGDTPSAISTD